jgi:WD40 repeat protein
MGCSSFFFSRQNESIACLDVTPDGAICATGHYHGLINLWDFRDLTRPVTYHTDNNDHKCVTSVEFHKNGRDILFNSESGYACLVDASSFDDTRKCNSFDGDKEHCHSKYYRGATNTYFLRNATFGNDHKCVLAGDDDGKIFVWSTASTKVVRVLSPPSEARDIHAVAMQHPIVRVLPTNSDAVSALVVTTDLGLFIWGEVDDKDADPISFSSTELTSTNSARDNLLGEDGEREEEGNEAWEDDGLDLDVGECSYNTRGYIRQIVYTCITCISSCSDEENEDYIGGICAQCAEWCHTRQGHEVRNIGMKRNFR